MGNKETVFNAMKKAGKPLKAGDLEKITGMKKTDVVKGIAELQKEGKVDSPKRCFYAVKK